MDYRIEYKCDETLAYVGLTCLFLQSVILCEYTEDLKNYIHLNNVLI